MSLPLNLLPPSGDIGIVPGLYWKGLSASASAVCCEVCEPCAVEIKDYTTDFFTACDCDDFPSSNEYDGKFHEFDDGPVPQCQNGNFGFNSINGKFFVNSYLITCPSDSPSNCTTPSGNTLTPGSCAIEVLCVKNDSEQKMIWYGTKSGEDRVGIYIFVSGCDPSHATIEIVNL